MNKNNLIEFKENGFVDYSTNKFYAYQSINSISPIKILKDDDYIHEKLGYKGKNDAMASLNIKFTIDMNCKDEVLIGYVYGVKLYEKVERKNKFMKFLFGKYKYVRNHELDTFYSEETPQMKDDIERLENTHNELIKKFNEWKINKVYK